MEFARNITDGLKGLFSNTNTVLTKTEAEDQNAHGDYKDENDSMEKRSRSCSVDSGFGDELADREDYSNNSNNNNNSNGFAEEAVISLEEVSEHNSPEDGWVVVGNYVYDVTHYLHKVSEEMIFEYNDLFPCSRCSTLVVWRCWASTSATTPPWPSGRASPKTNCLRID